MASSAVVGRIIKVRTGNFMRSYNSYEYAHRAGVKNKNMYLQFRTASKVCASCAMKELGCTYKPTLINRTEVRKDNVYQCDSYSEKEKK